jgi:hypothetical protein
MGKLPPHLQRHREALATLPQSGSGKGPLPGDVSKYTTRGTSTVKLPGTIEGDAALPGSDGGKPKAFWAQNPSKLTFGTVNTDYGTPTSGTAVSQAIWRTPLFDLRPDLGYRSGLRGNTVPIAREVMLGTEFGLFCYIRHTGGTTRFVTLPGIRAYSIEVGSTYDPGLADILQTPIDITLDVLNGRLRPVAQQSTAMLRWVPEQQLRYWGVIVVFDAMDVDPETLVVSGALH